jgi:hypothetical protein
VMHMPLGPLENEEAVVVYELAATVQVQERGHVFAGFVVNELFFYMHLVSLHICMHSSHLVSDYKHISGCTTYVASLEVEPSSIKLVGACKIRHAHAKMPEFVDGSGA